MFQNSHFIKSYLYAISKYGVKGIVDFLLRKSKEWIFHLREKKHLRESPPDCGITLFGCFDHTSSLSKVMRDFALLLKQANIPYQTFNTSCNNPIPHEEIENLLTPKAAYCPNKYTHIITMQTPIRPPDKRCRVNCIQFWEFEDGFIEYHPEALRATNVLALSDFNKTVFRKLLPLTIKVHKIQYPFQFVHGDLEPRKETRQRYGIDAEDFVAFFNFDFASSYYRKNPEASLHAFAKGIGDKPNAKIVFKTMNAAKCKDLSSRLHTVARELGIASKLITIDDFIPQEDLVNLTNACDVYISLHRGEGFGLGIAEAMSLGKAVVVTDYSSTKEFCTPHNSIPIPYKMVAVRPDQIDFSDYRKVTSWAEPDSNAAANALQRLYKDSTYRAELGRHARDFITDYFSLENFKKSILSFLSTA